MFINWKGLNLPFDLKIDNFILLIKSYCTLNSRMLS